MDSITKDNGMDAVSLVVKQNQLSEVSGSFEYLAGLDMVSETPLLKDNIYANINGICNGIEGYQPVFSVTDDWSNGIISNISYFSWKSNQSAFVAGVTGLTASSFKSGYSGYYYQNSKLFDAEKCTSIAKDDQMCWAASAANMLEYAGWDIYSSNTEDSILTIFINNFMYGDKYGGRTEYGIEWFLTGDYDASGWSEWDAPRSGTGGYYESFFVNNKLSNYLSITDFTLSGLRNAKEKLENGYAVGVSFGYYNSTLTVRSGGHAVTLWGLTYNTSLSVTDPNYFTGIIISDSDDDKSYYSVATSAPDTIKIISIYYDSSKQRYYLDPAYAGNYCYLDDLVFLAPYKETVSNYDLSAGKSDGAYGGPFNISTVSGTFSDSSKITTSDNVYLDWVIFNDADAINIGFQTALYLDGVLLYTWNTDSIDKGSICYVSDYNLGKLSAGNHTIKIVTDYGNKISETNENNNTYSETFYVSGNVASNVKIYSSGTLTSQGSSFTGAVIRGGGNNAMEVSSGGIASNTNISSGGAVHVFNKGFASSTNIYSSGKLNVSSGGTASFNYINTGAYLYALNGALVSNSYVSSGGRLIFSNGAIGRNNNIYSSGTAVVYSGAIASNNSVYTYGDIFIEGGQAYSNTITGSSAYLGVYSGGYASRNTVLSRGQISVFSKGSAAVTNLHSASMYVGDMGKVSSTYVSSGALMYVYDGGSSYYNYIYNNGDIMVSGSGALAYYTYVSSGGAVRVSNGASACYNYIYNGGELFVGQSGMISATTTLSSGATMTLSSGAMIRGTVNLAGTMIASDYVNASGAAINLQIANRTTSDTYMINNLSVISGGTYTITVSSTQTVGSYKLASGASGFTGTITVKDSNSVNYGSLSIGNSITYNDKKYTLNNTNGNLVLVISDASNYDLSVVETDEVYGGPLNISTVTGTYSDSSKITVSDNVYVDFLVFNNSDNITQSFQTALYLDGVLVQTWTHSDGLNKGYLSMLSDYNLGKLSAGNHTIKIVTDYGNKISETNENNNTYTETFYVSSNAASNVKIYSSGTLTSQGSSFTGAVIRGGGNNTMQVSSGGIVSSTNISSGGAVHIFSKGFALNTNIYSNGGLNISSGGTASNTFVYNGGSAVVSYGGLASGTTVKYGGIVRVYSGGWTDFTYISSGGYVLNSKGSVNNASVYEGGELYNIDGVNHNTYIRSGGYVELNGSAVDNAAYIASGGVLAVESNAVASKTTVNGVMYIYGSDALGLDGSVWSGGRIQVYSNGLAAFNIISSGGAMNVFSNGIAAYTTVLSGGSLWLGSGTIHFGTMTLANGASVSADNGANIVFDLNNDIDNSSYMINNLSLIKGTPYYLITAASDLNDGTYKLAQGASGFNATITISNDKDDYGTLYVNSSAITLGGKSYKLDLANGNLTLTVSGSKSSSIDNDLDGNGLADVVLVHTKQGYSGAWLSTGTNSVIKWGSLSNIKAGSKILGTGKLVGSADDGQDIFFADSKTVGAWNVVNGKVTGYKTIMSVNSTTNVLGLGDFNGDGATDLLLRSTSGDLGFYGTDGTGWEYLIGLGREWKVAAVGDLNGDGLDDTIVRHDAGFAGTFLTQKNGTVKWANLDTLAKDMTIVGTGDFNGDGVDDVLLQKSTGWVGAWIVKDGSVDGFMGICRNTDSIEQIADFNGDGIDDLRIRTDYGDIGVLYVKGADTTEWKYFQSVGKEWDTSFALIS